jgi:hypothetical protein
LSGGPQKVYVDMASGNGVFTTGETIRTVGSEKTGSVVYFANNSLGTLVVSILLAMGAGRDFIEIQNNRNFWNELGLYSLQESYDNGSDFYTLAGKLNIKCGGTVWKDHAIFYETVETDETPELALAKFNELYISCEGASPEN